MIQKLPNECDISHCKNGFVGMLKRFREMFNITHGLRMCTVLVDLFDV